MPKRSVPLPAPRGLSAQKLIVGNDEVIVFEFPLPTPRKVTGLTPAEHAVALAAAVGHSNAEIAKMRKRSPRTIAHQLQAIYEKLGVSGRIELARLFLGSDA